MPWTSSYSDPNESSGIQESIRVWEKTAHLESPGRGIELVINEIDYPLMGEPLFVFHLKIDLHFRVPGISESPLPDLPLILQDRSFIHIKIGVDRINTHDIREQSRIRLNQVSHRDLLPANPSSDRGGDLRKGQVQFCQFNRCLICQDLRCCLVLIGERSVEILFCNDSSLPEPVLSGKIRFLKLLVRLCLAQLSIGLIQCSLVRPWIDYKEEVPFIHQIAGFERNIIDISAYARGNVDALNGVSPASILVPLDDIFLNRFGDGHWRRGRCRRRWLVVTTRERYTYCE